ncbi:cytochrome c oxidase assembly protein [Nocardia sp. NPDC020380]|uniref:cytochrome c oxidase assembly protein n=1 Tax=Nocardia sp. NPDC020380 TaxID=3364309 RepID=UPI0037B23D9F
MVQIETPLHMSSLVTSWRWDTSTVLVTALLALVYAGCWVKARRNGAELPVRRAVTFGVAGLGIWLLTGISLIGVYSDTLFWVRALQILLLLYLVPFALAAGAPMTVLREALPPRARERMDAALSGSVARFLTYPAVPSLLILALPWVLLMSPWLEAVLRHGGIDAFTRILLVVIGFLYFYSRLQVDPTPKHVNQGFSVLITIGESIADGILGIVLWLGPLVGGGYYESLGRAWGPDLHTDQTIGAGILWLLGDFLGLIYALVVMRAWNADERRKARELDAELDAEEVRAKAGKVSARRGFAVEEDSAPATTGLWWENDPQLRDRFRR